MWVSWLLQGLARLLVGAYPRWVGCQPDASRQRIYIANHTSHVDVVAIWTALPSSIQRVTRSVAAWDYWANNTVKRYITTHGMNSIYIKRHRDEQSDEDPLDPLYEALARGESLIIFPEGTRNKDPIPQPFKSGIYHLLSRYPHVEVVPVYLENLSRIMPKGEYWPVPLACTARFGTPLYLRANESKDEFLVRARAGVIAARAPFAAAVQEG